MVSSPLLLVVSGASILVSLGALVCYVLCVVKMFQNQDTTYGILSLVLLLCGIGPLVALVRAYQMRDEWDIRNIVNIWLGIVAVNIVLAVVQYGFLGATMRPQMTP